jgi:hypothetical protein
LILKTRCAISCIANVYNAGVVTRDRRTGSRRLWVDGFRSFHYIFNAIFEIAKSYCFLNEKMTKKH